MKEAIIKSVQSRSFTTFQHLEADVPGFRGNHAMFSPIRESIIVWHAASAEAIEILGELIGEKQIFMQIAPKISYRNTGDLPNVPTYS